MPFQNLSRLPAEFRGPTRSPTPSTRRPPGLERGATPPQTAPPSSYVPSISTNPGVVDVTPTARGGGCGCGGGCGGCGNNSPQAQARPPLARLPVGVRDVTPAQPPAGISTVRGEQPRLLEGSACGPGEVASSQDLELTAEERSCLSAASASGAEAYSNATSTPLSCCTGEGGGANPGPIQDQMDQARSDYMKDFLDSLASSDCARLAALARAAQGGDDAAGQSFQDLIEDAAGGRLCGGYGPRHCMGEICEVPPAPCYEQFGPSGAPDSFPVNQCKPRPQVRFGAPITVSERDRGPTIPIPDLFLPPIFQFLNPPFPRPLPDPPRPRPLGCDYPECIGENCRTCCHFMAPEGEKSRCQSECCSGYR